MVDDVEDVVGSPVVSVVVPEEVVSELLVLVSPCVLVSVAVGSRQATVRQRHGRTTRPEGDGTERVFDISTLRFAPRTADSTPFTEQKKRY